MPTRRKKAAAENPVQRAADAMAEGQPTVTEPETVRETAGGAIAVSTTQPSLPDGQGGSVSELIEGIHNAAVAYLEARDAISAAKATWEVHRDALIVEMRKHDKTAYKHGSISVSLTERHTITVRDK